MKIEAIEPIIEWDARRHQMAVINPGATGDVSDELGQSLIASGRAKDPTWEKPAKPQLDHDGDGKPGGSMAGAESSAALGAARKRYKAAVGKQSGPKWDVATIEAKLAEFLAANPPAADDGGAGAEDDGAPAD